MMQSGTALLGTASPGWNLGSGTESREFQSPDVRFDQPFGSPPKIILALGGIEAPTGRPVRFLLQAADVEAGEFSIKVATWADSAITAIWVSWLAHD